MTRERRFRIFPKWQNALLALLGAGLMILAFPDFEWWWTAWFALVPLMWAIEREGKAMPAFFLGWLFGIACFFGTVWWLTYAPIHYAQVPAGLAYFLILVACVITGLFPALFAAILSRLLQRFGSWAFLAAPFVWVFSEFARYWVTGNDWNAIGYSQAFASVPNLRGAASVGGVLLISFYISLISAFFSHLLYLRSHVDKTKTLLQRIALIDRLVLYTFLTFVFPIYAVVVAFVDDDIKNVYRRPVQTPLRTRFLFTLPVILPIACMVFVFFASTMPRWDSNRIFSQGDEVAFVTAVQPNVPMSGLSVSEYGRLRDAQLTSASSAMEANVDKYAEANAKVYEGMPPEFTMDKSFFRKSYLSNYAQEPRLIILPESPMNFAYDDDREFQQYVRDFTTKNNVSLLFNSAEPDRETGKYFNSAVMVGADGKKVAEYDKIYLLPFGEAVPFPFEGLMPAVVGSFAYGRNYSLMPVGDAKAGVMICFESHFGSLSREYVREGADVLIEMTNDGYLGPTPVLRQHLANAVFRAVETNRPVLRVTNVGITAYITETGQVLDAAPAYTEATRVWSVSKSDGSQTFYVKYGDWFAWLCTVVTVVMLALSFRRRANTVAEARTE